MASTAGRTASRHAMYRRTQTLVFQQKNNTPRGHAYGVALTGHVVFFLERCALTREELDQEEATMGGGITLRASTFSGEEPGGARISRYPSSDHLVLFSMIDVHVDRDICVFRWLPTHAIIPGGHGLGLLIALNFFLNVDVRVAAHARSLRQKKGGRPLPSRTIVMSPLLTLSVHHFHRGDKTPGWSCCRL